MSHVLGEQGWRVSHFAGFPVMAVKRDWVIGMIDAHATDAKAAFDILKKWAQQNNVATSRLLVAVYYHTSREAVKIVTNFEDGNRMGPQAMAAVIQFVGGQFFPPKEPQWSPLTGYSKEILYDTQVDQELRESLRRVLSPR